MAKKNKVISTAEHKVLEVIWERSPISASQIINALADCESWSDRTIKSLISRLVKKKVISYKQENNRYFYYPVLKKDDYLQTASLSFIQRLFGGKISPLIANFAKTEKISKEEIKELKAILRELEVDD